MEQANCSMEAKFFNPRLQRDGSLQGINHNRFMVTDRGLYLGNLDWVGNEFTFNAGAGLVISQSEGVEDRNSTVVEQLQAAFERDWYSRYARSLQANKIPVCNKHQINRMFPGKSRHIDNGPAPLRKGQHDLGPVTLKGHHKEDGQTPEQTRHQDDRQSKISHQGMDNGLVPLRNSYQERVHYRMGHFDSRQVQIKGNSHDNPADLPSQSAESSGCREISNGSL